MKAEQEQILAGQEAHHLNLLNEAAKKEGYVSYPDKMRKEKAAYDLRMEGEDVNRKDAEEYSRRIAAEHFDADIGNANTASKKAGYTSFPAEKRAVAAADQAYMAANPDQFKPYPGSYAPPEQFAQPPKYAAGMTVEPTMGGPGYFTGAGKLAVGANPFNVMADHAYGLTGNADTTKPSRIEYNIGGDDDEVSAEASKKAKKK
jgi:hypothetical protein